jgi:hypothetical protein
LVGGSCWHYKFLITVFTLTTALFEIIATFIGHLFCLLVGYFQVGNMRVSVLFVSNRRSDWR